MITKNHKIWAEHPNDHSIKAVISGLKLYRSDWQKTSSYKDAGLWCVSASIDNVDSIYENYRSIPSPKPEVIFLAPEFKPMADSAWVFFKTPVNVRIFHKWLSSRGFQPEHDGSSIPSTTVQVTVARWKKEVFRMNRWPNVTQYSDNPNLIVMCSMAMHDWCDYSKLIPLGIDEKVLERILNDAEQSGNLTFREKTPVINSTDTDKPKKKRTKGLFRKLLEKFTK